MCRIDQALLKCDKFLKCDIMCRIDQATHLKFHCMMIMEMIAIMICVSLINTHTLPLAYNKNILSRFFFRFVWQHRYLYGLNGYNSRRVSVLLILFFPLVFLPVIVLLDIPLLFNPFHIDLYVFVSPFISYPSFVLFPYSFTLIDTHTYTHTQTQTYTHIHAHFTYFSFSYLHTHTCTHLHTLTHTYTHTHSTLTHTHTHLHIQSHTHTHTYTHTLTHSLTYSLTHTHSRTH